jgi:hypothetical protein
VLGGEALAALEELLDRAIPANACASIAVIVVLRPVGEERRRIDFVGFSVHPRHR